MLIMPIPAQPATMTATQPQALSNTLPHVLTQAVAPIGKNAVAPTPKGENSQKSRRRSENARENASGGAEDKRGKNVNISV